MSAIGDYVHLKESNYIKYGVAVGGHSKKRPSLTQVYLEQNRKNKQRIEQLPKINPAVLQELEKRVQHNFPEGNAKAKLSTQQAALDRNIVDRSINSFKQKFEQTSTFRKDLATKISSANKNYNTNFDLKAIRNAKRRCLDNIETINNNFKNNKPIQSRTIETLLKNFQAFFDLLGVQLTADDREWLMNKDFTKQPMYLALADAINAVAYSEINSATLYGQIGEQTVAMCGDVSLDVAQQSIAKAIRGSEVSQFKLDEKHISQKIQTLIKEETSLNLYNIRSSQNKVDVSIRVKDQPLDISVKAYSSKGSSIRVHLQDINLLYSLAATVPHFANHWLNIHAASSFKYPLLDSALAEAMRYEALVSGNLLKQGASLANTFVAIDTTHGRVYTASTREILLNNNGKNILLRPDIRTIRLENSEKVTTEQRIANIIRQVHKTQISATMKIALSPI